MTSDDNAQSGGSETVSVSIRMGPHGPVADLSCLPPMPALLPGEHPFFEIYMLECLRPGEDLMTGTLVFQDVIVQRMDLKRPSAPALVAACPHPDVLAAMLEGIRFRGECGSIAPVVIVDAHGNQDGIAFPRGAEMRWEALFQCLAPINELCRNRLMLVVSACEGAFAIKAVRPQGRAPFRVLVAPQNRMSAIDAQRAITALVETLLDTHQWSSSFRAMQAAVEDTSDDPSKPAFIMRTCDWLYDYLVQQVPWSSRSKRAKRVEKMLSNQRNNGALDPSRLSAMRRHFKFRLAQEYRKLTTEGRKRFLMIDLYPELEREFGVSVRPRGR